MRTYIIFIKTFRLLCIFLFLAILSCGNYQGVSYYGSDGIYGGNSGALNTKKITSSSKNEDNVYYKNYFGYLANDYSSLENPEGEIFTDTDNYSSNQNNGNISINSQAPWGDKTSRTEIYYINNNPWGYFNNGWAFNRGFFNSFFDPFWGGFYGTGFRNFFYPWGFNYYAPFNGYGFPFAHGYPFRSRYYNGSYAFNGHNMGYSYSGFSRGNNVYSKSNTSRGGRSSQVISSDNKINRNQTNSGSSFQGSSSNNKRYNVGRRSESTNPSKYNNSTSRSNSQKTNSSRRSTNNYSSRRSSYESTNRSSTNYRPSQYSSYSSGRSYSSSPSYNSGSRNSSGSSRSSSSRGR